MGNSPNLSYKLSEIAIKVRFSLRNEIILKLTESIE